MLLLAAACNKPEPVRMVERDTPLPTGSRPWKINSARSAAPAEVSKDATVIDFPASDTAQGEELALGASGVTCWPDNPRTPVNDPVCEDAGGREWEYASQARRAPRVATIGLIYRLQGSAEDPPHIGLILPNPQRAFAGLPTTQQADEPYVKFPGTPWAYLIIPAAQRR